MTASAEGYIAFAVSLINRLLGVTFPDFATDSQHEPYHQDHRHLLDLNVQNNNIDSPVNADTSNPFSDA